jgi:hypothetical protein
MLKCKEAMKRPIFYKTEMGDFAYYVPADNYVMDGFQSEQEAINWAHHDGWDVSHVDENPGPPNIVKIDRSEKALLTDHKQLQSLLK